MKHLLISFLCFISIINAYAENTFFQLSISNGDKVAIALTDEPFITFSDGMLIIKTADTEVCYPQHDVLMYRFIDDTNSINNIYSNNDVFISNTSNGLNISGLPENNEIYIYTIDGVLINKLIPVDRAINIDFSLYQKGIYIIKIGNLSYKYMWK